MNKLFSLLAVSLLLSCGGNRNMIELPVPERPSGQTDVLDLACEKVENVKIAIIGAEIQGIDAALRLTKLKGVSIKAIYDNIPENLSTIQSILKENRLPAAEEYYGEGNWRQVCEREDIDLIYICVPVGLRTEIATFAMDAGKHVASAAPLAVTINDCWDLVNTAEKTRRHCTMVQYGNYDPFELATLNMGQLGFFGEITRIETGSRLAVNAIAPAAHLLNIHRGDKFSYIESVKGAENSLIKTEKGVTILIHTDSISSLPSGREYNIIGKWASAKKSGDRSFSYNQPDTSWQSLQVTDSLLKVYAHPIVRDFKKLDLIADYRLVYCLRNGLPLDMDVYDVAEWCAVAPLSKLSSLNNGKAVMFPDFTRNLWNKLKGYKQYKNDK